MCCEYDEVVVWLVVVFEELVVYEFVVVEFLMWVELI